MANVICIAFPVTSDEVGDGYIAARFTLFGSGVVRKRYEGLRNLAQVKICLKSEIEMATEADQEDDVVLEPDSDDGDVESCHIEAHRTQTRTS
jgi:hypothetical protein